MKNILVSSYGVCPNIDKHPGSEFSISWNFVNKLAKTNKFHITLLVGSSDGELKGFENLRDINVDNIDFIFVKTSKLTHAIFHFIYNKLGITFIWPIYLRFWNKSAFKVAKKLHEKINFDIAHQYNPGGFKNPGYLWKLSTKSIWGPVFGLHFFNLRLAYNQSFLYFLKCLIWNCSNYLFRYDLYVINGAKKYNKVWFGTYDTKNYFDKFFNVTGDQISEQSIDDVKYIQNFIDKKSNKSLKIIWIGRIEYRKNLKLFLDICKSIDNASKPIEVFILGKGPLLDRYKSYWERTNPNINLSFLDHMPRNQLMEFIEDCHVVAFSSMAEGNTSVIFEAMEKGLIPIALDSHGFSSSITDNIGVKVNPNMPYPKIVTEYANKIISFTNLDKLKIYQENLVKYSYKNSWKETISKHIKIYQED